MVVRSTPPPFLNTVSPQPHSWNWLNTFTSCACTNRSVLRPTPFSVNA